MSTGTQIAKVHQLTSTGTIGIAKNGNFFIRLCGRLLENLGTGRRKPAHYSSMTLSQLEQRAQEDMAIAKAMGF
jgi:hypothetical protein